MKTEDQLLNEVHEIAYVDPTIIYQKSPIVALSLYQDKHLLSWFVHNSGPFYYQSKKYTLVHLVLDVVDYDRDLIEAIIDLAIKKSSIFFMRNKLPEVIDTEHLSLDDYSAKEIVAILLEDGEKMDL